MENRNPFSSQTSSMIPFQIGQNKLLQADSLDASILLK